MKYFYFFLIFVILLEIVHSLDSNYFNSFVKSVLMYFRSRSLIIVTGGSISKYKIFKLNKYLRNDENMYFYSAMTTKVFLKTIKNGYHADKRPVVIAEYNEELFNETFAKLTNEKDISFYKWLIINPNMEIENFEKTKIPIITEFLVTDGNFSTNSNIAEIYDIQPKVKHIQNIGVWDAANKNILQYSSTDLFQRRRNFNKGIIKIITPNHDPCAKASFAFGVGEIVVCIHQNLWVTIAEMLNAHSEEVIIPSMDVHTIETVDADLMLRSAPLNPIDFQTRSYMWPIFASKLVVVASYTGQEVDWKTYIKPFNKEMWLLILIWIILCEAIFLIHEIISVFINKKEKPFLNYYSKYSFLALFAFCNQGTTDTPKRISHRLLLFAVFLVPTVLVPGYSAELTSFITVQLPKMPFRNIEELSWLKEYALGWHYTFPTKLMFNMHDKTPVYRRLLDHNVLPDNRMPRTDREAVERICKEKFVFISDISTIVALKPKCKYFKLDHSFITVFNSMEVKKNNPLQYFLNRCERQLQFSGVQKRIVIQTVIKDVPSWTPLEKFDEKISPIMIENGALPFAVLFCSMVLAIFIFFLEIIWFKLKNQKTNFLHI